MHSVYKGYTFPPNKYPYDNSEILVVEVKKVIGVAIKEAHRRELDKMRPAGNMKI